MESPNDMHDLQDMTGLGAGEQVASEQNGCAGNDPTGSDRTNSGNLSGSDHTNNSRIILAFDTSTDMLACAVGRLAEGKIELLASSDHLCRRKANVELVTTCENTLAEAGLTMKDVDGVLVGRGPGSFTGVRIGIATAKGIACGTNLPLYGTSALDAVAWSMWKQGVRGKVAVAADAMRGEVYPGIYLLTDGGAQRTFESETVMKAAACAETWGARDDRDELLVSGGGLTKHRAAFEAASLSHFADEMSWLPTGEGLLLAWASADGQRRAGNGDPALVLPVYTRLSDAEESERKRLGLSLPASVQVTGVDDALASIHLQLRPMSVNDLSAVAQLEQDAFAESAHTPWTRNMFFEELSQPGRSWWVAHDRGHVIGFAGGMLAGDDLELLDVAVEESRRRQGIATRLISRVAYDGQMLGAHHLSLEVDAQNAPAQKTYAKLGMSEAGRRDNYYGDGHDALILRADLPLALDEKLVGERPEPKPSLRPWPSHVAARSAEDNERIAAAAPLILSIESSCDETAMAVISGKGEILANVVATQIDFHARFGGVVPEIASRKHTEAIVGVYEETMVRAGATLGVDSLVPADLTAVGVTSGPGLVGALVVGVAFAKGLCIGAKLPLLPAHHLEGHLFANLFETPELQPPFVASLVSGGNTMLVHVRSWGDYEILGSTIDDAVGEAFDKVAKALGLGYPGGPVISRLSAQGNPKAIHFPRAMMHSHDFRFSLSGLKTSVITYIEGENKAGRPVNLPDLAASFEAAVIDVQVAKAVEAVRQTGVKEFCVGGGVAANRGLRAAYKEAFGKMGVRVTVPPMIVCGDNAAMIALVALRNWRAGLQAPLTLDADPNAKLDAWTSAEAPVVDNTAWPPRK